MDVFLDFIAQYGLVAMVVLITLEYACFPMPSEILLPLSGAVAAQEGISFLLLYGLSLIAGLSGCLFCYSIGRVGGYLFIEMLQKRFPKSQKGLNAAQEKFDRCSGWAVLLGRMIPICRTYISFIAGAGQQPLLQFMGCSAVGIAIWNFLLLGGGYVFRENWNWITSRYPYICLGLGVVILGILCFSFFKQSKKKRYPILIILKK